MYHRIMVAVTVAFAVAFVAYILIAGKPVDPVLRAHGYRRSPDTSSNSFRTKLFRSAAERRSMSAGSTIPRMNLTRAVLGIVYSLKPSRPPPSSDKPRRSTWRGLLYRVQMLTMPQASILHRKVV